MAESSPTPSVDITERAVQAVFTHIFTRIHYTWVDLLRGINEEYSALEDQVYEHPSDSKIAQHLWAMSQHLHEMLKLINRHAKLIEGVQEDFALFAEIEADDENHGWLKAVIDDFNLVSNELEMDYIEPLGSLIDLVSSPLFLYCLTFKEREI